MKKKQKYPKLPPRMQAKAEAISQALKLKMKGKK